MCSFPKNPCTFGIWISCLWYGNVLILEFAKVIFTFSTVNISTFPYHKHEIHIPKVQGFLGKLHIYQCYYHFLKHDIHILQNDFQIDAIRPYPFDKHYFHFWKSGWHIPHINFNYQKLENIWMKCNQLVLSKTSLS